MRDRITTLISEIEGICKASRIAKTAGEGNLKVTIPAAIKWIDDLVKYAGKAKQELKSKNGPGRSTAEFVGHMKGYKDEDWYDHFFG